MSAATDFTLRFPFKIAPGQQIIGLEAPHELSVGPLTWRLAYVEPFYVFTITGLGSEQECHEYKHRLWAALMWVQLQRGIAFKVEHEFERIAYAADPEQAAQNLERSMGITYQGPIDGLANSNFPLAYPSSKQLRLCTTGDSSLSVGTPAQQILTTAQEGLSIRDGMPVPLDSRLHTALDLYAAYWYEQTSNAKFLTLILALECLLTPTARHSVAREALDAWGIELEARRDAFMPDTAEYIAIDSLLREIVFKKSDSLRMQVRSLVKGSLNAVHNPRADVLSAKAVKVYDARSALVHEGSLPPQELNQATQDAKEIVELVLRAKYHCP